MAGHPPDAGQRALLLGLFEAAVAAAAPALVVPPHLPPRPKGRTVVVGAGKAAAAMAAAVEACWDGPLEGVVVTRYGHGAPTSRVRVVEAAHPVPDAAGPEAARAVLAAAGGLGPDDLLLCLISGGGSSLMALPAPGVSLADKQAVNRALLRSGARIDEINAVRKHLSAVKGGRLALAAHPARVVALAISDVPGDDLSVIASGPTVADPSTRGDALDVLARYAIDAPPAVLRRLADPACETPKPGDSRLRGVETTVIATPRAALEAAARAARRAGVHPVTLGDAIEGEAREVGRAQAALALRQAAAGEPRPVVLLSGGETTVTVRGGGRGGRNAEFLLALGLALDGHPGISALACDTDGIDGSESNAGALWLPDSAARGRDLDLAGRLAANDAYGAFEALGDLVVTGPTRTNVNDFRAVLVRPL